MGFYFNSFGGGGGEFSSGRLVVSIFASYEFKKMCIILFCYTLDYLSQANVYLVISMITDPHVATLAINIARPPVYYSTKSFRIMSFFEIKGSAIL